MSGDAARLRGAGGAAPPASRDRSVYPNNESANAQFVDNVIVTCVPSRLPLLAPVS